MIGNGRKVTFSPRVMTDGELVRAEKRARLGVVARVRRRARIARWVWLGVKVALCIGIGLLLAWAVR